MVLMYDGVVLEERKRVGECGVREVNFLVAVIQVCYYYCYCYCSCCFFGVDVWWSGVYVIEVNFLLVVIQVLLLFVVVVVCGCCCCLCCGGGGGCLLLLWLLLMVGVVSGFFIQY